MKALEGRVARGLIPSPNPMALTLLKALKGLVGFVRKQGDLAKQLPHLAKNLGGAVQARSDVVSSAGAGSDVVTHVVSTLSLLSAHLAWAVEVYRCGGIELCGARETCASGPAWAQA